MTSGPVRRALLIDLDGVVRTWDPQRLAAVERDHGVTEGSVAAAAFGGDSALREAVVGRITDDEWRADVVRRLEPVCGTAVATAVVAAWSCDAGSVDAAALGVVRSARAAGWRVGLMTNATTRLRDDLRALDLTDEFDVIVSSAEVGLAKPDTRAFVVACERLAVPPRGCVFVDDTSSNVAAAADAGLAAYVYEGAPRLAEVLGIAVRGST